jgi:hypothetical protein
MLSINLNHSNHFIMINYLFITYLYFFLYFMLNLNFKFKIFINIVYFIVKFTNNFFVILFIDLIIIFTNGLFMFSPLNIKISSTNYIFSKIIVKFLIIKVIIMQDFIIIILDYF